MARTRDAVGWWLNNPSRGLSGGRGAGANCTGVWSGAARLGGDTETTTARAAGTDKDGTGAENTLRSFFFSLAASGTAIFARVSGKKPSPTASAVRAPKITSSTAVCAWSVLLVAWNKAWQVPSWNKRIGTERLNTGLRSAGAARQAANASTRAANRCHGQDDGSQCARNILCGLTPSSLATGRAQASAELGTSLTAMGCSLERVVRCQLTGGCPHGGGVPVWWWLGTRPPTVPHGTHAR